MMINFVVLNGGIIMRNFKRILSIALTLIVIMSFSACDKNTATQPSETVVSTLETENIISKDKRFKVVETTKDGQPAFTYTLYDSYGNVVFEQTVLREPQIKYITEDVIEIRNSAGTSAISCTYFDLKTNKLSESCWNPSYVDGNIVAYMHYDETREPHTFLVVRNIFDSTKKYIEYDFDFSPVAVPANAIKSIKRLDDKLEIVYYKGENRTEVTVNVNLK